MHQKPQPTIPEKIRMPRGREVFGLVVQLIGGARMIVQCKDGKERMCRVPGSIKKRVWVREGDYVLVEPWSVDSDAKGDIAYRYVGAQVEELKRKGLIQSNTGSVRTN
ncbi:Translation initiation factor 1A [uncultured archaeon]|nr:Translation initiation factor 1A [uncultured archaeon]